MATTATETEVAPRVMPCERVSWAQVEDLVRRLAGDIRAAGFRPDIIVAIGRGGWVPARLLSDRLAVFNLTSFKIEHYRGAEKGSRARIRYPLAADVTGQQVLLVDDVSDSGDTFELALAHLQAQGPPAGVRSAVLHHKRVCRYRPDFLAAEIAEWRWLTYPWALLEDVSGFIQRLGLAEAEPSALAAAIEAGYGLRLPQRTLREAQALLRDCKAGGRMRSQMRSEIE
ncbi:phosphoribosyltransferase [Thiohalobacter sp. IOR34]|uniref:phosphoribosyltransferase n=1 Tax=Thiohalobacter sp. IOR34 TaxID=3057176 RepID=UPI0025B0A88B|nr:phosphoribosyltransferase [Thiohalobacter sp. IOR34]WJW76403.1 phosphoribosyltransferase [Thiohalobacter sp. IOR34]